MSLHGNTILAMEIDKLRVLRHSYYSLNLNQNKEFNMHKYYPHQFELQSLGSQTDTEILR